MSKYSEALGILSEAAKLGSKPGLSRITLLAQLLGKPQDKFKCIHVTGTNGKGSFCAMLSSVLQKQGYKVGTFSSPALLTPNDCIRIDKNEISDDVFAEAVIRAGCAVSSMKDRPTEFEILTAAAFYCFASQGCDIAVIECGMGGDGDATNIIDAPLLSVITNVSLDHMNWLGKTVAEIAMHKAGIIKKGCPVFFGGDDVSAFEVIKSVSEKQGSELFCASCDDIKPLNDTLATRIIYKGNELYIPLLGTYQYQNAVNVINCVEILRSRGVEISDSSLHDGLADVKWKGRFEKLCNDPLIIFDGAHNADGMRELCKSIRLYFPDNRPALLIGVLADKEYKLYSDMLRGLTDSVFVVSPNNPRALSSHELSCLLSAEGFVSAPYESILEGFEAAYHHSLNTGCPLLIVGSLYMYRDIIDAKNIVCKK